MTTRTKVPASAVLALAMLTTGLFGAMNAAATALATPAFSTTATPSSVVIGGQVSDSATLSGGTAPTGTITFALYGPADPTCGTALATSTASVTGAGTYHSAAFTTNTVGTYRWIARYGGDPNNTAVGGTCGAAAQSVQVALPSSGAGVYVVGSDPVHGKPEVTQYTVAVDGSLSSKNPAAVAIPTGSDPDSIVVSADGRRAYAAGFGLSTVYQFNVAPDGTLSPMAPAAVATGNRPSAIALSLDGKHAYVTNFLDRTVSQFAIAMDGTLTPAGTVATGDSPVAIALSADGKNAYVVNNNDKTVAQYAIAVDGSLSVMGAAATGVSPRGILLSRDGKNAYVLDSNSIVSQYTIAADGTLSPQTPATVATGQFPIAFAMSPDGRSLYVANTGPSGQSMSSVSQYSISADGTLSPKTPATVATTVNPQGIALSPDGSSAYVINTGNNTLWQYNAAADGTLSPKTPAFIAADQGLRGIAVAPPQGTRTTTALGVAQTCPAAAGSVETLTATVSPSAAGTVLFLDGGALLGGPVPVSNGTASINTTLTSGNHALNAVFTPADFTVFAGSISAPVSFTVEAPATSTALAVTPTSPVGAGTPETLTATVSPTASGAVQFLDGSAPLGSAVSVVGGTASLVTILAPGTHSLSAVFTPADPTAFGASTSPPVSYTVNAHGPRCIRVCR